MKLSIKFKTVTLLSICVLGSFTLSHSAEAVMPLPGGGLKAATPAYWCEHT